MIVILSELIYDFFSLINGSQSATSDVRLVTSENSQLVCII